MIHYADLGAVAYVNGHPHWHNRAIPVTVKRPRWAAARQNRLTWVYGVPR